MAIVGAPTIPVSGIISQVRSIAIDVLRATGLSDGEAIAAIRSYILALSR